MSCTHLHAKLNPLTTLTHLDPFLAFSGSVLSCWHLLIIKIYQRQLYLLKLEVKKNEQCLIIKFVVRRH